MRSRGRSTSTSKATRLGPIYATLFVGILDPATRELRYVNAGHNPQYILRTNGSARAHVVVGPAGGLARRPRLHRSARCSSRAGDLLFFYTDGCVEAENEAGDMFGAEQLEALLVSAAGADDLLARVESVLTAVSRQARAVRRRDDDGGQGRIAGEFGSAHGQAGFLP